MERLARLRRKRLMPTTGVEAAKFERILKCWTEYKRGRLLSPEEEQLAFAHWLLRLSGLVISTDVHLRRIRQLQEEAQGDRQVLLIVGATARGQREFKLANGTSAEHLGTGLCQANALPGYAAKGDVLLLTSSEPQCRNCGCTNSRACAGGCKWVQPNLCSRCQPRRRG